MQRGKSFFRGLLIFASAIIVISLIGFADFVTGARLSFSIAYLVAIALFSLFRETNTLKVVFISLLATMVSFTGDYLATDQKYLFFEFWNAFFKLAAFASIGLLVLYLKESQIKLRAVNKNLHTTNQEKNKFMGIAAHDLRNPISGIYSLSGLMLADDDVKANPKLTESLSYIKTLSSDSLTILQDLLNITRIESGKIELKLKSEDYISFIGEQIALSQLLAQQKNITILFEPQMPAIVADFDRNYMREVIGNLLSNAIKYSTQNSKIRVTVTLNRDGDVMTEVADNGKGIAEEEQKKLFRYFQTTSTQPTNGEQSTGLGLAIAKQVISLHNGNIWVKSKLNQGSTFYYTFPQHNRQL